MKKNYILLLVLLFAFLTNAQIKIQGVPRNDIKQITTAKNQLTNKSNATVFEDIQYWVGTGSNKAAFVVQWNDGKSADALVWGFRWDGTATGEDMMKAIAKADRRFFTLLYQGTQYGTAIGGLGFDLNGVKRNGLYKGADLKYPFYPISGIVNTSDYDFDSYTAIDADDHWKSGWTTGFWAYWKKDPSNTDFEFSSDGASSRTLENGSWDVWNYTPVGDSVDVTSTFTPVAPYVASTDFTNGFFMVNEEWFGHTNGSVNFVGNDGNINYRIYSENNDNKAFGATTQYGTIYGDKFYFISKQAADGGDMQYTPGGRLVIANANNMKRIASFDNIGGGDGRSFLGVNENTGYIGALNGIFLFDIANLQVGSLIPQTGGGQIGNMIRTSQYVFAVKQSEGILVIDPVSHTVIKTISGEFNSVVQAKDGSIWAIQDLKLINIDALTFETTAYTIPTTMYVGSWGAWNAGSFTYSNQQDALYWITGVNAYVSGKQIVKFDIVSKTFNENFAEIPGQTGTYKQIPYGAALRIDPVSDRLILNTTESGFGAHFQKNWIHTFDNTGNLIDTNTLDDYYWFPSLAVFPDNNAPVVSTTLPTEVSLTGITKIDLKTVVSDADNLSVAIVKSIKSNSNAAAVSASINTNDELVLQPLNGGDATIVIGFNSNGKVVEKSITIKGDGTLGVGDFQKIQLAIYPNPVSEILNIQTQDKVLKVEIYDISGKVIHSELNRNQINVSSFIKGFYLINVVTDKAKYVQKFIKN